MGVIVLHYNNPIMGGGFTYSHGLNNMVLYYFESIATCSVDLFMLISGYFMEKCEKRNLWKAIELISQVMIFQIDWYLIGIIRGHEFTVKGFIGRFLPTNYFVTLYCAVYVLSLYFSFVMSRLGKKTLKMTLAVLLLCFSILPTLVDFIEGMSGHSLTGLNPLGMYGDGAGYTFVNFFCFGWLVHIFL